MNIRSLYKRPAPVLPALLAALALALSACVPSLEPGRTGNLRLIFGGGEGRALASATVAALSYRLDFSGPAGETLTRTIEQGGRSLTLSLDPGKWTIRAAAYLEGRRFGTGETTVLMESGKTSSAAIAMTVSDDAFSWYVAVGGSNANAGTEAAPFATVQAAVDAIAAAYNDTWPGYNTPSAETARIVVNGTIAESGTIYTGMVAIRELSTLYDTYPPITLEGGTDGGTISYTGPSHIPVLHAEGVDINLGPGLTLTGGNESGVYFTGAGTLHINGANISDNTAASDGGGVYVASGNFTMSGGTISDNTAATNGGGVYVASGNFTMTGGTIGGTDPSDGNTAADGGGVYFKGSTFSMSDTAKIVGNTATADGRGGGVYMVKNTSVTTSMYMSGGTIDGNTADGSGGGVFVASQTSLTMIGGIISGNTASGTGAYAGGGGVYVFATGAFAKSGNSTITGSGHTNANDAGDGHAVYVSDYPTIKKRNGTAGPDIILIKAADGTTSGDWD